MATAKPRVTRERKKRQAGNYYSRTEQSKGDTHRRRTSDQVQVTGTFARHGRPQSPAHAKKVAKARKTERTTDGRFKAIVAGERKRDENYIWTGSFDKKPRTYAKRTGRPDATQLRHHAKAKAKAGVPIEGKKRHTTRRAVSIADALRVLKSRHRTVSAVARALGLPRSTVDGWYRGVKPRAAAKSRLLRAA